MREILLEEAVNSSLKILKTPGILETGCCWPPSPQYLGSTLSITFPPGRLSGKFSRLKPHLCTEFSSETGKIVTKWHWHNCFQVTLAQLFPSDTDANIPTSHRHDCSQVTLARLIPNDTGTIVPKWDLHDCSQVALARLFPSDTYTIVPMINYQIFWCIMVFN